MLEKKHLVFLAGATAPFAPPLCTALQLMCRTASFAEAGEIERRIFGAPNTVTVVAFGVGHENSEVQGQQNVEQENSNNIENTEEKTSRKLEHFP